MNGASKDTQKILTEKLELARQIATLQPEIEHLRAQTASQQKVLGEKLALESQVAELEAELEATKNNAMKKGTTGSAKKEAELEKQLEALKKELVKERKEKEKALKATEAEAAKEDGAAAKRDAKIEEKLEQLKKNLAAEKHEREQIQKAAERDAREWEGTRQVLEDKVEAMRTKLRSVKAELKEAQASLAETIANAEKSSKDAAKDAKARAKSVPQLQDMSIGTPDGIIMRKKTAAIKRTKPALAEKSTFSITPFLNKTTILQTSTPTINGATEENDTGPEVAQEESMLEPGDSPSAARNMPPPPPPVAKSQAKKRKADTEPAAAQPKKRKAPAPILEQVPEEADEDDEPAPAVAMPPPKVRKIMKPLLNASMPALAPEPAAEPKKMKRKILGAASTIFDEDDAEATRGPPTQAKGMRKLGLGGRKNALMGEGRLDAFSPLKKDRRGVQASFLG